LDEFKAKLREKYYELNPGRKAANDLERVSEIFESAIQQEVLVAHLPDIPNEALKVTDIDQEIEERLLRLKFFNQSWLPNKNSNSPHPIAVIDMGDDEFDELHSDEQNLEVRELSSGDDNVDVAENSVETETFT
jgi:hypothetical protein